MFYLILIKFCFIIIIQIGVLMRNQTTERGSIYFKFNENGVLWYPPHQALG